MESDITQTAQLYSLLGWLDKNRKQIIASAVVITLVGIVVAYVIWQKERKEVNAGEALSALLLAEKGQSNVTSEALLRIVDENRGTEAASRALLAAAERQFSDGKKDEAQKLFQRFAAEYDGTPLTSQAKYGVAICLDAQGKTNEAVTAFKEVVDRYASANTVTPAKFHLARLYEATDKLEQARDLYLDLARTSQSTYATEASQRLMNLFQKHPNLRPSATPSALGATNMVPAK